MLSTKLNSNWNFGGDDEDNIRDLCESNFNEQPISGRDVRYADIGDWYRASIEKPYRGNFRIGTEWGLKTHPLNLICMFLTFMPCETWEMHIMSQQKGLEGLVDSAIHAMARGR